MTRTEEFLRIELSEASYTFEREWLRALQEEMRELHSRDWWTEADRTKLRDCQEDKAAILSSLKDLLEHWYEAPVVIKFDTADDFGEAGEPGDEEEECK
jgi:hypothetical protein